MGFLRQIARKTLRRSRPHGLRGKRIEPTVDEEMERMREDAEIEAEQAVEDDQWLMDAEWDAHWAAMDEQRDRDDDMCPCGGFCTNRDPCIDPHDLF